MSVLLTGGLGYIGSNVCLKLEQSGISTVIIDNLSNSYVKVKDDLDDMVGRNIDIYQTDINDQGLLQAIFLKHDIDCVMHFAGMKSAPDSIVMPMAYYSNNLKGALNVLEAGLKQGLKRFIFSSSATVYGSPTELPIVETHQLLPLNPYASSKLMFENCLRDVASSELDFKAISLRYFNPVGADASGRLGENPREGNKNLAPSIINAALGNIDYLSVYGTDYDTPDGTAIRDYVHVLDVAEGHLKAYKAINKVNKSAEFNLGTGHGYSVNEMIASFEDKCGLTIPVKYMPRRNGDVAVCYADATKANEYLGWQAKLNLDAMCISAWNSANTLDKK